MFKYVLFAALLAFASAKPKPLVLEYDYPVAYSAPVAAYSAPVAYSYSAYDYALPYSAYAYSPYSYYVR
uniref:Cuticle protein n=1 Tax=Heliothis virescens TaxID=7102 RepID=A0A2A4K3U1_HELVI